MYFECCRFTFISKCWLADKHSRPTFNCIKNHFNQLLFAAAMMKETDEGRFSEWFTVNMQQIIIIFNMY
ncbi:MET [Bugula neritina]|uniref:MET n=1 Tax=Bugula neritina TaxID=10212 RepID=A0A7J7J9W8_BUGNE|nr:MET [Bugula neritina]